MSQQPAPAVHVLGIRHHGPGSARSVRAALERLQPDIVLVEGPPDANELLPLAGHADMKPPVALLVHAADRPSRAVFYPFAIFSPEWQAILYALQRGVPVRFIDLPQAHQLGEEAGSEEAEGPQEPGELMRDPFGELARAAGYEDGERWWEHLFEQRQEAEGVFEAVLEAMRAMREGQGELPPREARREAHMRRCIREAKKEGFQRLAVVCGAWHSPALLEPRSAKEDDALLRGLPKVKVAATWIPWTNGRLSFRSGYGAGVDSPGWYAHLWAEPKRPVVSWVARIAHLLREEGLDASSANVIEAVRLAEALAALRGHSSVGLAELREAAHSVLCSGESAPLSLIHDKLEVGLDFGGVPAEAPAVPLARDLSALQKSLRLQPSAELKALELDLRKDLDRGRSRLLHRLRLLGVPWGTPQQATTGKTGTFGEAWQLKWEPELSVKLVEASPYGNTVESAAAARVLSLAAEAPGLEVLSPLLEASLLAELPAAIEAVLARIQALSARSADVPRLLEAFPPLVQALRYGSVRETPTGPILAIIRGLFERMLIGLAGACTGLDAEAAHARREQVRAVHAAVALLEDKERGEEWAQALGQLIYRDAVHGVVRGAALRLLVDLGRVEDEELGRLARRALSPAVAPSEAAAWLEGLVTGGALLLLHRREVWAALDGWLTALPREAFVEQLPLVRRAFADFSPAERRAMGERVRELSSAPEPSKAAAAEELEPERVAKVLPVLSAILGVQLHETA